MASGRVKGSVNLEKTLKHMTSSFAYKDPYKPAGGIFYKLRNKVQTFFSSRNMENEFVDFKTIYLQDQIPELYYDLMDAYKARDKNTLKRGLSESMFDLLTTKNLEIDVSFVPKIQKLKLVSARIYIGGQVYLAEEQWAQITLSINNGEQFAVFERR